MKKFVFIIFMFFIFPVFAQDTTYILKTYIRFLPDVTSISEKLTLCTGKSKYSNIFNQYKWVGIDKKRKKAINKVVKKKQIKSKKNKEQVLSSLKWITNHRYDSLFFFDKKTIEWDSLKKIVDDWNYYQISETDIEKFRNNQTEKILININQFCKPGFEGHVIDGAPYSIRLVVYSKNFSDTITFEDNSSSPSIYYKNLRNWLLFYTVNKQTSFYMHIGFMNDYFKSDKIFYIILMKYIWALKNGCNSNNL